MSTQQPNANAAALDGQGLYENAKDELSAGTVAQIKANSAQARDKLRTNATSLPLSALETLDETVMEPLYQRLAIVQRFEQAGLTHDLQWWETESSWGIRGRMNEAEHTSDLLTNSEEGALPEGREGVAVPYTIKNYRLKQSTIERANAFGRNIEPEYADAAGRSVGELLEDTMLYGSKIQLSTPHGNTLGCPGMLNVDGRIQYPASGTWDDGPTAKNDLIDAIGTLGDNGYDTDSEGAWLIGGTKLNTYFQRDYRSDVYADSSTREKLDEVTGFDDFIYAPRMPDGEAILLLPTDEVIDMARLPDGPLNLSEENQFGQNNKFKLFQLLAPRIKHNQDGGTGIVHIAGTGTA